MADTRPTPLPSTEELDPTHRRDPLALLAAAGQTLALMVFLLPVGGWAVRFVAFRMDDAVSGPARIAFALPLPELAYLGLLNIFLLLLPPLGMVFLIAARDAPAMLAVSNAREHRDEMRERVEMREIGLKADRVAQQTGAPTDLDARIREGVALLQADRQNLEVAQATLDEVREPLHRGRVHQFLYHRIGPLPYVAGLVLVGVIFLTTPAFPAFLLVLLTATIASQWILRVARRTGRVTLATTWPAIVATMVVSAIFGGLTYWPDEAAAYHFDSATQLQDGWYVRIGETPELMFLRSCKDGSAHSVSISDVRSVLFANRTVSRNWPHESLSTVIGFVLKGERLRLGVTYSCPPTDPSGSRQPFQWHVGDLSQLGLPARVRT